MVFSNPSFNALSATVKQYIFLPYRFACEVSFVMSDLYFVSGSACCQMLNFFKLDERAFKVAGYNLEMSFFLCSVQDADRNSSAAIMFS